ncbi:MAG TPA: M66 family metalloprotease, partial [Allosphingosinicella sp.]
MLKFHATPIHFAAASAAFFMPAPAALAQSVASIDGLEVTQSTQHYESNRHLSNASDYGPTNSLALIERKAVFVRAYVRGGTSAGVQLTGTLTIERQGAQGWEPVASVEARAPVTMVAQPDYRTVRGDMGRTLAFAIPATEVHGILRLTARARRVGQTTVAAERQVVLPRPLLRTLRVAAITVGYNGPRPGSRDRIEAPPPTLQDVERTAGTTLAAFPVGAEAEFRIAGTITQTEPLLTGQIAPMFACPRTWSDLMRRVRRIRAADGPRPGWVYYGLLAAELPFKSSTVGCGGGGVGTGKTDWDWTMAHEIGHAAGLPHIPGRNNRCTGDGADSRYPRYRPYRRGSIGEYGVDIRTGAVHRPAGAH